MLRMPFFALQSSHSEAKKGALFMAKQVKIITFINDREGRESGEETLTTLVNEGWEIKSSGGGTGAEMVWGFVILQKEVDDAPAPKSWKE